MEVIKIPRYREIKLNSFKPLCRNELGQRAIKDYKFLPFIDASCRREPDFENPHPSISALCRQGSFAPNLHLGDVIIYITVQGHYHPYSEGHHRLVAILQVIDIYDSHIRGKIEYNKLLVDTPSNCMVQDNLPYDFDKTAGNFKNVKQLKHFLQKTDEEQKNIGHKLVQLWDNAYLQKSKMWPCFVRTKPLYVNCKDPQPIFRQDFEAIFNRIPNTRTANKISKEQLIALGKLIGINIVIG